MKVPPETHPFYHRQAVQMRFNDLDALGHVNNSVYFEYMDFGKVQYITQVLGDSFNLHKESLVIANINCDFYEISRYGEPLEVLSRVDEITEHTIVFEQRIVNTANNHVKVIARIVMVGFDIEEAAKMAIPPAWRRAIAQFEHRTDL